MAFYKIKKVWKLKDNKVNLIYQIEMGEKAKIKNPGAPGELLRAVLLFVPVLYRYSHQDRLLD